MCCTFIHLQAASDAMLTVTITDCNDHPPILSQSSYAFTIAERTAGPSADETVFSGILVTDNDASASNRAMQFEVVGDVATTTNNWFDINSATVSTGILILLTLVNMAIHITLSDSPPLQQPTSLLYKRVCFNICICTYSSIRVQLSSVKMLSLIEKILLS